MWPTLKALKAMGGSASNEELLAKVIELEGIPEDVASFLHTDNRQTRSGYNLGWSKTWLKSGGALENSMRGVWAITDVGARMAEADVAPLIAVVRRERNERHRAEAQEDTAESLETLEAGPTSEEHWKDQLLACLRQISSDAFERLAQRILRESGFTRVEVTGRSGDGGIDGIGVLRVNLLSFHVLFQCKRYQGSVGAREIRDFRGAMVGRSDKGLFITTGTFTSEAQREATRDGAPAIDLIDGEQLCDVLKRLKLGIRVETIEKPMVDAEWFKKI
jgi:restriction system protein